MAKKKNNQTAEKIDVQEGYYDLKTEAVEKLVNAKDAPEVSEAELRKYRSKGRLSIPTWLKVVFGKFWFSGAVCYFFFWGLGNYIPSRLDLLVVTAMGLGVVTDLMLNHILRSLEPEERVYDRWMMITTRKFWSLFLNVIYAGVLMFCVYQSYYVINTILVGDANTADKIAVGVEPILFGLLYTGFDMFFIMLKNIFLKILHDAMNKAAGSGK